MSTIAHGHGRRRFADRAQDHRALAGARRLSGAAGRDGVEALEQLLDIVPDVMLVDIEMPRMDGFDLTAQRACRRAPEIDTDHHDHLADGRKHRTYAFEIGVNHYLGKPYQEDELLGLVADYVTKQRHV